MAAEPRETILQLQLAGKFVPGFFYVFRETADGHRCMSWASPGIAELFGLQPADVAEDAAPLFARIHPDDLAAVAGSIDAAHAAGTPWMREFRVCHPERGVLTVLGRSEPAQEGDGTIVCHGFIQDVTELRRREADLARAQGALVTLNDRHVLAQRSVGFGIWEFDRATGWLEIDATLRAMLGGGLPAAGPARVMLPAVLPRDGRLMLSYALVAGLRHGRVIDVTLRVMRAGDEIGWIRVAARPIAGTGRLVGLALDVTEQMLSARKLDAALAEAERASRAKTAFLAAMSHDLRTPMNGVMGLAALMADMQLQPRQREFLSMMRASGEELMQLLSDILDLSRLDAGFLEIRPEPGSLRDMLGRVERLHAGSAAARGLALEVRADPRLPPAHLLDMQRCLQILNNLVANAIRHTDAGKVEVTVAPVGSGRVRMRVADTGNGIAPDVLDTLFETAGIVGDEHSLPAPRGSGLGLAIVSGLVQAMGGTIRVESRRGEGSRFEVTLPLTELVRAEPDPRHAAG